MAVSKNFVVKNGIEVNENLIVADSITNRVGVGSTTPNATLDVKGKVASNTATITDQFIVGSSGTVFNVYSNEANIVGGGDTVIIGGKTSIDNSLTVEQLATFKSSVVIDSAATLRLPVGATTERPSPAEIGQIRYNNTLNTFEGYGGGNVWNSLAGLRDVDSDTFIIAESIPSADEDILYIYNKGVLSGTISSTEKNFVGVVSANSYLGEGGNLTLGTGNTDGNLVTPGALNTFTSNTKLIDSIDDLNELALNIIKNTTVTEVDFSADTLAGGSPLTVNATVTHTGNADFYDYDWGDGNIDYNQSTANKSHTYTNPLGGVFSVAVTAKDSSGAGAGSSQTQTRSNYITVYTPDPDVTFELYRTTTGGTALTGNDLYVLEGEYLYLDNNTTRTSNGVSPTYSINWGDESAISLVNSNTVGGGASESAPRLGHQWVEGTKSTGLDTITLTLATHTTADPAILPLSGTKQIKVYEDTPTLPNDLSTKTLPPPATVGVPARLAVGFADNIPGGTSLTAGNAVNRVTGVATAGPLQSFAYNADSGFLQALVNGVGRGGRTLTTGDQSGTYTDLIIFSEQDYQLLDADGDDVTLANSIYYPGFARGFKAGITSSSLPFGMNGMQLTHTESGNTNVAEFMRDYLTVTPTVSIASAQVTELSGSNKRFISGIPYYRTGDQIRVSGLSVDNLTGNTYADASNIIEIDDSTNLEGTTGSSITNSDFGYNSVNNLISPMLTGAIPNAGVGTITGYDVAILPVDITSSNVKCINKLKVRAQNNNGFGSYTSDLVTKVMVHNAEQSGISEIAISVADALGSIYDDDGVRIFDFNAATADNPSFNGSTNFYTNNPYTESSDPGVSGTKEATIRFGVLKHDVTDYSNGYLPVGPDRTLDTGTQYFTFAFRRQLVANFTVNINSSTGIHGLWIAAPGTQIDSTSGLNGWLNASATYAGSGVPGSGAGGNGSDGCAFTSGDRVTTGSAINDAFTLTLGSENMSNATGNVVLVRIALNTGQTVSSLSIS